MKRLLAVGWLAFFLLPLLAMLALDGFCSGGELCRAGLYFTLLLYGGGLIAFFIAVLLARLIFRGLHLSPPKRLATMKCLLFIPLIPPLVLLVLLIRSLTGTL
ncbi:MAG: hypothetical protein V4681_03745 [Patescibacteria group bacterium]